MTSDISSELSAGLRETPPEGPPPKPFHLPVTTDFTLPNGMRATIVPYGIVPKVAVRVFVGAGAIHESAGQVWLSRLNAALMKEGTRTRTAEQVAEEAAEMGGQIEIDAGADFTSIGGVVLSDFAPKFVALLADVLTAPLLPDSELPRLKADLLRDLSIDKSTPEALAQERFVATLFPNHPYGRAFPSESALGGYEIEDVRTFYLSHFEAARAHIYIAGKLEGDLRGAVEEAFSGWAKGTPARALPVRPMNARSLQVVDRPGAEQSNLLIGLPVPDPTSPDFIKLDVMNTLLGGSFASRITTNIREEKGYTYSPVSQVGTHPHLAYWVQSADVATDVTGPSLDEIFYEIDLLSKEPPDPEELQGIQNYLAGIFVLRNTISPDAIIGQLHFVDSQGLDRSYLSTYVRKVMDVTPTDVQAMADAYLVPSRMTIVVVGDKARIAEQIAPYEAATE